MVSKSLEDKNVCHNEHERSDNRAHPQDVCGESLFLTTIIAPTENEIENVEEQTNER